MLHFNKHKFTHDIELDFIPFNPTPLETQNPNRFGIIHYTKTFTFFLEEIDMYIIMKVFVNMYIFIYCIH